MKSSDSVAICKQPLPQCALELFRFRLTIKKQFEGCQHPIGNSKTTIKRSCRFSGSFRKRLQYIIVNQEIKYASRDLADFHHVVWTHFITSFGRFLPRRLALCLGSGTQRKTPQGQFLRTRQPIASLPSQQALRTAQKRCRQPEPGLPAASFNNDQVI